MSEYTKFENDEFKVCEIIKKTNPNNQREPQWNIPDMQRQFVWKDRQIISFLNSLFMGYPVGAILIWEKGESVHRPVGAERQPSNTASEEITNLIIDGQQRITSLKVIFEGMEYERGGLYRAMNIQFNPTLDPLASDAILESPRFKSIPHNREPDPKCVTVLDVFYYIEEEGKKKGQRVFRPEASVNDFKEAYIKKYPNLTEEEKSNFYESVTRIRDVYNAYEIAAVLLKEGTTPAEAAEIFVRINSSGTRLDMANFIMTALSLHDQQLKDAIHKFSEEANQSIIFEMEPIDALASLVGYTFAEPLGKKAYDMLEGKGKKNATRKEEEELQKVNLGLLDENIKHVCNVKHWDNFITAVKEAGIGSKKYLSSEASLLTAYSIYLMIVSKKDLDHQVQKNAISIWLLFCSLTRRYSAHTDNVTRTDLNKFIKLETGGEIVNKIYDIIDSALSSPEAILYAAKEAENILTICLYQQNEKTLFGELTIRQIVDNAKSSKTKLDEHHLFPIAYMKKAHKYSLEKIRDEVDVCGNLAPIYSRENKEISDAAPSEYVPRIKERYNEKEWEEMCAKFALPKNWWSLKYDDFIKGRHELLPAVIKKSFDNLRSYKRR